MPPPIIYGPRPWSAVLGMSAVILGALGVTLCWMLPVGLILAAAGLLLGVIGWAVAVRRNRVQPGILILGTILSLIALILNVIIVTGGVTYLMTRLWGY